MVIGRFRYPVMIGAFALAAVLAVAFAVAQESPRIPNPTAPATSTPLPAAADASAEPMPADPAEQQRDLAFRLYPSLLEMGLDIVPGDDPAKSVLTAVNALRRQDNQRGYQTLDNGVVAWVEQKVSVWRTQRALTIRIQGALDALGFDPGPLDGIYGPLTTEAVRRYQRSAALAPNGVLTAEQVDTLEMKSIDRLMRPQDAKQQQTVGAPTMPAETDVAQPAKAPEIDPDLLDYIGR